VVGRGDVDVCARYVCYSTVRATLHLEAKSIRCVRGLKSSLLIGQKIAIFVNLGLFRHFEIVTNIRTWIKSHVYWRML
jgi:hypothetical protein